jgi:hypothetical protein
MNAAQHLSRIIAIAALNTGIAALVRLFACEDMHCKQLFFMTLVVSNSRTITMPTCKMMGSGGNLCADGTFCHKKYFTRTRKILFDFVYDQMFGRL